MRFAALIRVSTERQEKTGESLRTQRSGIETIARQLDSEIVGWYGGQEHATAGWEKKEIERLLADACESTRTWDAVIVASADRWSRDNESNRKGLEVFRKHKVRFFVGASEYDLFNPEHCLFLEMSSAFGSFQARNQKLKSILNRIHRAKRGFPTAGLLPYGRTFDKDAGKWGIDKAKQKIIEDAARRYLAGEQLPQIADEYGMNHSNLHKILTKRSGTVWEQTFKSEELNIEETVTIEIPALLPPKVIKAIQQKVDANRTYTHGQIRHRYLLSRMIFCGTCGYALFGQTNHNEHRYYRHPHAKRERPCNAKKTWIIADEIEDTVIRHLFHMMGNPKAVENAIKEAILDIKSVRRMQERMSRIDEMLHNTDKGRQTVVQLILDGKLDKAEAEDRLQKSKDKEYRLREERERLTATLANAPTAEQAKAAGKRVSKAFVRMNAKIDVANIDFNRMTWEQKRALCEEVFSGKTPDGRRMGVYVIWPQDGGKLRLTIQGHLIDQTVNATLTDDSKEWLTDSQVTNYATHSRDTAPL